MSKNLEKLSPTNRFTNRAGNYAKYRPSYPAVIIDFLQQEAGLKKDSTIADIGSGTGIFSALLLESGYQVWGVEPNREMREAGEAYLKDYTKFTSVNGKAESTSLVDRSIDLICVAQAFHWMEPDTSAREFKRILKPGGRILLLWNIRLTNTPFLQAFEQLKIDFGTDYLATRMSKEPDINKFFAPAGMKYTCLPHSQLLDFEGLKGQLLSTSYIPLEGDRNKQMLHALELLFERYQENRMVQIEYETKLYLSH